MPEIEPVPTELPLDDWLARLARPQGAPGGGAASGVALALSAGLLHMTAGYTDDPQAVEAEARLATGRRDALAAAEADGVRSAEFGAALALPSDDPAREARVRDGAVAAAQSSVDLGEVGVALLPDLRLLAEIANPNLGADLAIAAQALATGIFGAAVNLRANLRIARSHAADASTCAALADDAARLAAARAEAREIAEQVSARFDG
ncbi:cyclodeaminase/cyclohydrolase family protein [Microbacterium sp. 179-I 3D4 NHS]|uniref:cyclodeaminase/cyclohydrolase family protein n=1 Tax=Microbacterium sp. 179-I 3D4 NHS TaxID=3142381 RepID=UPI00399F9179